MNFLRYYFFYIFLHLTLTGSSLVQIGDAISVKLDASATYKHTSNILKSEVGEISDSFYVFSPGAVFNIGTPGTPLDLKVKAKYDIFQYNDYDIYDINRLKVYLDGSYIPSQLSSSVFSYSNIESQSARSELSTKANPALVEVSTENASFFATYKYSPKLSFSLGANQKEITYDTYTDELASKKSTSIPFKVIYHYTNKLSLLYGVTFTDTEVGPKTKYSLPGYNTDSIYYNVGLKGIILPKLSGHFDVGYRTLEFDTSLKDFNAFGVTSSLKWTMSPKFYTTINISRDFDAAGSGGTYRFTRGNFTSVYSINTEYKLSFNFGHTAKFFRKNPIMNTKSRGEKLTNASFNLHYYPSQNYSFSTGYNYIKSDALYDYDLREFKLSANFKY
ncbi:MAG: Uncharacterised protein [Puniceicoccaceae bacterium MED-G32]|nr:MAG: Uncharacterised protein [Puniceicoccaceae bacterium MED-G32]